MDNAVLSVEISATVVFMVISIVFGNCTITTPSLRGEEKKKVHDGTVCSYDCRFVKGDSN